MFFLEQIPNLYMFFLGIYLTYPFLAQERGGGVLDGLKKKSTPGDF